MSEFIKYLTESEPYDEYSYGYYEEEKPDLFEINEDECKDAWEIFVKEVLKYLIDHIKEMSNDVLSIDELSSDFDTEFDNQKSSEKFLSEIHLNINYGGSDEFFEIDVELTSDDGLFEGKDWQKYYPATYWEPAEGGYFEYVEYNGDVKKEANDLYDQIKEQISEDAYEKIFSYEDEDEEYEG